jgi:hypothetical protein
VRRALLPLLAPLRERSLYAALAAGLVLWSLAYQLPYGPAFAVGGDAATGRRYDDAPFLLGVNAPEPDQSGVADWRTIPPGYGYRWASGDATLLLPGLGGGVWRLEVGAASGRAGEGVRSEWLAGDRRYALEIAPAVERPRVYRVLAPADASGDVALRMLTPRLNTGDPRDLGLVLTSVRAAPAGGGLRLPALPQLGWLALALALAYAQLRAAGLSARHALLAGLALALLAAALLAIARLALTSFTPALAAVLAGGFALTAALRLLAFAALQTAEAGPQTADRSTSNNSERSEHGGGLRSAVGGRERSEQSAASAQRFLAALVGIVALAWALRLGGMLHPQYRFSDVYFNANNLLKLELGRVYFTAGLPAESGGGDAPYPPGMYLALAPLQALFPPTLDGRALLLKVGVALLDSLAAGLIGLVLWRGAGARAALLGAALYVAPPPQLLSFSVGEFANIGGQALALPALATLALFAATDKGQRLAPLVFSLQPIALLCIGLLAHSGVAISLACALAGLWLVRSAGALRSGDWRRLARLTTVGILAGALAAAIYYSAPIFMSIFAARLAGPGAVPAPAGETPLGRALGSLGSVIAWRGKIVPPLAVVGALGLALLLTRRRGGDVWALAAAWWLGTLLSLGLLAAARQGVRWDLFFFPALCLCGGAALDALWRRGRWGRLVTLALTIFPIYYGVVFWVAQVRNNYH